MENTFDPEPKGHSPITILYLTPPEVISTPVGNGNNYVSSAEIILALKLIRQIGVGTEDDKAILVVESALRSLRAIEQTSSAEIRVVSLPRPDHNEYDSFFNVVRVWGNTTQYLVFSLCIAYRDFLVDAQRGHSLPPTEWLLLRQAFNEYAEVLWDIFCRNQEEQ